MELWKEILLLTFTPAAIIAAVAYVVRKLFDRSLERDLQKFSHELSIQQFEHQTRYSLIHQKRAEVIGELYGRLVHAVDELNRLTSILQFADGVPLPEKKKKAASISNDFIDYFNQNRIYLDDELCERIDALIKVMHSAFIDFDVALTGDKYEPDPSGLWQKAFKQMREEVLPIKAELEKQFRKSIGVAAEQ